MNDPLMALAVAFGPGVCGPGHSEDLQYLRVCIGQHRQKLAGSGVTTDLIQTEPGIGYRI